MVSKFLTAHVVLQSLRHYARQAGFWKEILVGGMLVGNCEKSNKGTYFESLDRI